MVDPLVACALATAALGVWEFVTARRLLKSTRWVLSPRATRWAGAYTCVASLLVVALALAHNSGIAFISYAVMALGFAAFAEATRMRRAKT